MPEDTNHIYLCSASPLIHSLINNCIDEMEVGCLEYPGASTIGSQPLD